MTYPFVLLLLYNPPSGMPNQNVFIFAVFYSMFNFLLTISALFLFIYCPCSQFFSHLCLQNSFCLLFSVLYCLLIDLPQYFDATINWLWCSINTQLIQLHSNDANAQARFQYDFVLSSELVV